MITDLKNPKKVQNKTYTVQMKGEGKAVINLPIFKGSAETQLTDRVAALKLQKAYMDGNPGKEFRIMEVDATVTTYDWMKQSKLKRLVKTIKTKQNAPKS